MVRIIAVLAFTLSAISNAGEGVFVPELGTFIPADGIHLSRNFGLRSFQFSSDESQIIAGYTDGKIVFWDIESGKEKVILDCGSGSIEDLAMASPKRLVVWISETENDNSKIQIWDVPGQRLIKSTAIKGIKRFCSDSHSKFLVISTDAELKVMAIQSLAIIHSLSTQMPLPVFTDNGNHLTVVSWPNKGGYPVATILKVSTFKEEKELELPMYDVTSISVSSDSSLIALGGTHGSRPGDASDYSDLWVWEYPQFLLKKAPRKFSFGKEPRTHPDWRLAKPLYPQKDKIQDIAFSPDNAFIMGARCYGVTVWSVKDGKMIAKVPRFNANIVGFSGSGKWCAADYPGTIYVQRTKKFIQAWEVRTGGNSVAPKVQKSE